MTLRRQTPLRRGGVLNRRSWMRTRRAKPRRNERVRDLEYLAIASGFGCYALGTVPGHVCDGPVEVDHQGPRAAGRKANDDTGVPLCELAHQQRDAFHGPFRSWNQARMRAWREEGIAHTRAAVVLIKSRREGALDDQ